MPTAPTSYRDVIDDACAAVGLLRSREYIDPARIALVGHSEGAQTAGIMAAEDPEIAAICLLAGTSLTLDRILLEQGMYRRALKKLVDPVQPGKLAFTYRKLLKVVEEAKAGKKDEKRSDVYEYMRQHAASDPRKTLARVKCPVLILQAERDNNVLTYHALESAFALMNAGNKKVALRIFPNLTHAFTPDPATPKITAVELNTVSKTMLETLAKWLAKNL